MQIHASDRPLILKHSTDPVFKTLNKFGYNVDRSFDIPPGGVISTVFEQDTTKKCDHYASFSLPDLSRRNRVVYKINVNYSYFKIPITMQFIVEKYRVTEESIDDYLLVTSKEYISTFCFKCWI
jgi:hypothetical protein